MSAGRHSKLQLQVLALYKQCLRVATPKTGFRETVRMEFRRNAAVPRTDILRIEQLMRGGFRHDFRLEHSVIHIRYR
jgi:succinate dehydrogenase assembly factor 1